MNYTYHPFQPTLTPSALVKFGFTLKTSSPNDLLKDTVHSFLQITSKTATPYPVMPDGTQAIYFSQNGAMIAGALHEAQDVQMLQAGDYFGIWFKPGALRHFFRLNLSEIAGQFVDSQYFQCASFSRLHDEIYRHSSFSQRMAVCEKWLLSRFIATPITKFDHALSLIYQSHGSAKIGVLADKVDWSSRHLNRQFLQHTGLSIKRFSEVIRVQSFCQQVHLNPTQSLETAFELGYYDQSHLIKSFKKQLKSTPSTFFHRFMS